MTGLCAVCHRLFDADEWSAHSCTEGTPVAYVKTVTVLRENVQAGVRSARQALAFGAPSLALANLDLLLEQLDADVREVLADVECVMDGGNQW